MTKIGLPVANAVRPCMTLRANPALAERFGSGDGPADKHYRAPAHFEKPSRLIKNENAFKSADEVKLNRTETIAFRSE